MLCVRQLGPDQQIALEDWECEDLERPADMSACRRQQACPPERGQWRTGPWSDVRVTRSQITTAVVFFYQWS